MSVSIGGFDLKHSLLDLKDGDVKSASSKVKHCDSETSKVAFYNLGSSRILTVCLFPIDKAYFVFIPTISSYYSDNTWKCKLICS